MILLRQVYLTSLRWFVTGCLIVLCSSWYLWLPTSVYEFYRALSYIEILQLIQIYHGLPRSLTGLQHAPNEFTFGKSCLGFCFAGISHCFVKSYLYPAIAIGAKLRQLTFVENGISLQYG